MSSVHHFGTPLLSQTCVAISELLPGPPSDCPALDRTGSWWLSGFKYIPLRVYSIKVGLTYFGFSCMGTHNWLNRTDEGPFRQESFSC